MKALRSAIHVELLKAWRSKVPLATALGITLVPLVGALFMYILKDPERARRLGILGTKAQLAASAADWPAYFNLLGQAIAVGGLLLFAIATAWIFGREFSDRTIRTLLALPTSRLVVVTAKVVVLEAWCAALALWALVLGVTLGALIALPGFGHDVFVQGVSRFALAAGMTAALQSATAVAASAGRGYLAPLGWAMLTMFLAQVLAATGWGAFFPWSVPALAVHIAGDGEDIVGPASYVVVAMTALVGFAGVLLWWQKADQPA